MRVIFKPGRNVEERVTMRRRGGAGLAEEMAVGK
jgi:hypothetical protein